MMNPLKCAIFGACLLLPASAKLVFETTSLEIDLTPDQNEVIGSFPFTATGEGETIVSYKALCTCLGPRVEPLLPDRSPKLNWKAGESGVMKVKFDTSRFRGTVEKAVELNLKGEKEPVILVIKVNIPELIVLEPSSLKWDVGSEAEEKVVRIKVNHSKPIKITSHTANNVRIFPYEFRTIKEGWEYEVRIKPTDTSVSGMGVVSLRTDCEISKFKRATVYAVVKPKLKALPKPVE